MNEKNAQTEKSYNERRRKMYKNGQQQIILLS